MAEPMVSENLIAQLTTLSESESYFQAFLLAQDQPLEQSELNKFSMPGSLVTKPDGASVSIRHLSGDKDDWLSIGITPIDRQRFPLGAMEVRIQKPNFRTLQFTLINPSLTLDNFRYAVDSPLIPLVGEDQYPDEFA